MGAASATNMQQMQMNRQMQQGQQMGYGAENGSVQVDRWDMAQEMAAFQVDRWVIAQEIMVPRQSSRPSL